MRSEGRVVKVAKATRCDSRRIRVMEDFLAVAETVLAEAYAFAAASSFSDGPEDSDGKFERFKSDSPLPSGPELAQVLRETFWASLIAEEGRPCRPRLLYAPSSPPDGAPVVTLVKPVSLDRAQLRKFSPAHGDTGFATWRFYSEGTPMIDGIRSHGARDALTITCPGVGAVDDAVASLQVGDSAR